MNFNRQVRCHQENADKNLLRYPFSFINTENIYKSTVTQIVAQKKYDDSNLEEFPHNIKEYLWVYSGNYDMETWKCLCLLNNNLYVFYTASSNNTGFNSSGDMKFYISENPYILIKFAMTDYDYYLYENDTKEPEIIDAKFAGIRK